MCVLSPANIEEEEYMQKRGSKVLAAVLTAAMVFTGAAGFVATGSVTAQAATMQKEYQVTKAKSSVGDTTKYTYNKKGLVKKSVTTSNSSSDDSDTKTTTTTT